MDFRVLGTLEVLNEGRPVPITAPRERMVLAVLLVHANEVVPNDRLLDLVWGPDQADVRSIRYQIWKLRETLGEAKPSHSWTMPMRCGEGIPIPSSSMRSSLTWSGSGSVRCAGGRSRINSICSWNLVSTTT